MDWNATQLSAVVLAGGKSSRFGKDKTQMELGGRNVLDHLLSVLRDFPFQRLAIATSPGRDRNRPEGLLVLLDDRVGIGPIGGIVTALRHLPEDILVVACDMPLVSIRLIDWILSEYDPRAAAVIPRHGRGIEPLFAIYQKGILPLFEDAIRVGRYALHDVLKDASVRFADLPDEFSPERELANINTPEDYERIKKLADESF